MSDSDLDKEIKDLVVIRLESLPEGVGLSIGSEGEFSKQELIFRVKKGDEIGKKIIEMEMNFLRALKTGALYEPLYFGDEA